MIVCESAVTERFTSCEYIHSLRVINTSCQDVENKLAIPVIRRLQNGQSYVIIFHVLHFINHFSLQCITIC